MPRITAEREEATRKRILSAAKDVFAEKGFHDASIDDVVRASGLSVGAIYTYFKGKDELVQYACLDAINEAIDGVLTDLRSGGSVREKLERAIDTWLEGFAGHPADKAFLVQAWSVAHEVPSIRDMLIRRRERIITVASILIREGMATGELRSDIEVERVARGLSALLDGELLVEAESERRPDLVRQELLAIVALLAWPPERAAGG